jgi:hypothetical protein
LLPTRAVRFRTLHYQAHLTLREDESFLIRTCPKGEEERSEGSDRETRVSMLVGLLVGGCSTGVAYRGPQQSDLVGTWTPDYAARFDGVAGTR